MSRTTASKMLVAAVVGLLLSAGFWTVSASASTSFTVTGTGNGIYPRAGTSMSAATVGAALPDGAAVSVVCETYGETVDNGYAPSNVWARLSAGTYLPNAFILTGYDGRTPGVPDCSFIGDTGATPEEAEDVSGIFAINDGAIYNQLLNHYYGQTGQEVEVDWSLFSNDSSLVAWAKSLPIDNAEYTYSSNAVADGFDVWASLGAFAVRRTSEHCYVVRDVYDFSLMSPEFVQAFDAVTGAAVPFNVNASGCIS